MLYTTIQITKLTKEKLNRLKPSKKVTYDKVIDTLLYLIPIGDEEGPYTSKFMASLLRSLIDIKAGRAYPSSNVKQKLDI